MANPQTDGVPRRNVKEKGAVQTDMFMPIAGHTMATPELSPVEAIRLYASLGLDGIEFVSDDASGLLPDRVDATARRELRSALEAHGLRLACLTPYFWDINAADPIRRRGQVEGAKQALALAADLGASVVRAFAGRPPTTLSGEGTAAEDEMRRAVERATTSLQELGRAASDLGLRIGVENHKGTLATSAQATSALVEACGSPSVGIVYDQANLDELGAEPWQDALALQFQRIVHVHVKDFDYGGAAGARRARVLGEGVVAWPQILATLAARGYAGFLSLEYERKWHPDELPPSAEGLPRCAAFIRAQLANLAPATVTRAATAATLAVTPGGSRA